MHLRQRTANRYVLGLTGFILDINIMSLRGQNYNVIIVETWGEGGGHVWHRQEMVSYALRGGGGGGAFASD